MVLGCSSVQFKEKDLLGIKQFFRLAPESRPARDLKYDRINAALDEAAKYTC